jgi:hypothetical protein
MPAVKSFIRNMTGLEPVSGAVNPDEAVALGACRTVLPGCNLRSKSTQHWHIT